MINKTVNIISVIKYSTSKEGFAEVSKNLARYWSKNSFVWTIKIIMQGVQTCCLIC